MRRVSLLRFLLVLACAVCLVAPQSGCVGLASHMVYWLRGNKVDARCTALEGKRVAVVCVSGSGIIGPNNEGEALARVVGAILQKNVRKVEVIRPEQVAEWRDTNNWDEIDYKSIGRGVKADMVVALDLASWSTHDDATILRGRANVKTTVYDMQNRGTIVFRDGPREFMFPKHGAQHAVENETDFSRMFLIMLAQDVAKNFYAYDKIDDVASDPTFIGH